MLCLETGIDGGDVVYWGKEQHSTEKDEEKGGRDDCEHNGYSSSLFLRFSWRVLDGR